jgi:hypothetical protein
MLVPYKATEPMNWLAMVARDILLRQSPLNPGSGTGMIGNWHDSIAGAFELSAYTGPLAHSGLITASHVRPC